jgi:hypothetical protein
VVEVEPHVPHRLVAVQLDLRGRDTLSLPCVVSLVVSCRVVRKRRVPASRTPCR